MLDWLMNNWLDALEIALLIWVSSITYLLTLPGHQYELLTAIRRVESLVKEGLDQ